MFSEVLFAALLAAAVVVARPQYARDSVSTKVITTVAASPSTSVVATTPKSYPQGHITTFLPAVHWDHDLYDMSNLIPSGRLPMNYTSSGVADPSVGHRFAAMDVELQNPTVILEHSAYVQKITCQNPGLQITLSTAAAFSVVQQSWNITTGFFLVSHTDGCQTASGDGQRTYWRVSNTTFIKNRLDVLVSCQEIAVEEALTAVNMTWGTYSPISDKTTGSTADSKGTVPTSGGGDFSGGSFTFSCPPPPAASIDGFPTAACGPNFDKALDNAIGYINLNDPNNFSAHLKDVAPGFTDDNFNDYHDGNDTFAPSTSNQLRREKIEQRDIGSFFKGVGDFFKKGFKVIEKGVQALVNPTLQTGTDLVNAVSDVLPHEIHGDIPLDIGPPKDKITQIANFGDAFPLFDDKVNGVSVKLGCVNCGVTGKIHYQGVAKFHIGGKDLGELNLQVDGNVEAGLELALEAQGSFTETKTIDIVSFSPPGTGFSIPSVLTLGLALEIKTKLDLDVNAAAAIKVGARMTIPEFKVTLDAINNDKSSSNLKPEFTPVFAASGKITVTASIGLPVGIAFGIQIPPIGLDETLGLFDTPQISAKVSVSDGSQPADSESCPNGIFGELKFTNDVVFHALHAFTATLASFTGPSTTTCVSLAKRTVDAIAGRNIEEAAAFITPTPEPSAIPAPYIARRGNSHQTASAKSPSGSSSPTAVFDDNLANDAFDDADLESLNTTAIAAVDVEESHGETPDGIVYNSIKDISGKFALVSDINGNFYPEDVSKVGGEFLYGSSSNVTVMDDQDRIFHYYPDFMNKFGVSRFRLSSIEAVPKTADLIALVPVDGDNSAATPGILVATDTMGSKFFTVACNIQGQPSKIFLVSDVAKGSAMLKQENLIYTVTGGKVTNCATLLWTSIGPGFSLNN